MSESRKKSNENIARLIQPIEKSFSMSESHEETVKDSFPIKGEFRGDFTRDTFDPAKNYTRVLMQQGRVQLDADWNEQTDILLHYMRALAADLIGPFGGPCFNAGFEITKENSNESRDKREHSEDSDLNIGTGHYYIDGILCVNENSVTYLRQQDYPSPKKLPEPPYLVYLDVWERTATCNEDPNIREVALGLNGPDTATRSQLVWQVKAVSPAKIKEFLSESNACKGIKQNWDRVKQVLRPRSTGKLKAEALKSADYTKPCNISPESRYRGVENQLYRVEIHKSGFAGTATFKWSRENSSVNFHITSLGEKVATLAHLGRDDRTTLSPGDWVEVIDDDHVLKEEPGDLLKIASVERSTMTVTFSNGTSTSFRGKNLHLRRWDHKSPDSENGAMVVKKNELLDLEDGIKIQFEQGYYNTGDYWLIPARTATGDVLWPYTNEKKTERQYLPPHGIEHHYAPLAVVVPSCESGCESEAGIKVIDCRCTFKRICSIEKYIEISGWDIGQNNETVKISGSTNLSVGDIILWATSCDPSSPMETQTGSAKIMAGSPDNKFEFTVRNNKVCEFIVTAVALKCGEVKDELNININW